MKKLFLSLVVLMIAGLQTVSSQGFRVYKSDGTVAQFSLRTDSIVFYDGIGSDSDFGPFTPVNQCIAKTWYMSKSETVTFNEDGTTNYMSGATYEFMPYQGSIIIYNAYGTPVNIFKVHKVTDDKMIVNALGDSKFKVWATTPQPQFVEEIVLNETSIILRPDERIALSATVLPEEADNKEVTWESSNNDVAEVNSSGKVTANADGTCIITCRATDSSGVYTECEVTVETHSCVNLDLPSGTLWATCNVGANYPEEYGDYFAWGETQPKDYYDWRTYQHCNGSNSTITKYFKNGEGNTELDPEDDAATTNWDENWQMPSIEQFQELINSEYTTKEWTTKNDVNGWLITSKSNNKSIFLPTAGWYQKNTFREAGGCCFYWSRTLGSDKERAVNQFHYTSDITISEGLRCYGLSVRPVRKQ